jgi:chitinase
METRHRLSPLRLLIVVLAVCGLGFAGWTQGSEAYSRITTTPSSTWFAPYNDVTLTPEYHFEDPIVSPSLTQVLGFVVADPKNHCNPTWGTYYDLAGAGSALDLDRRITRLRERGGDVVVSFGGAINDELAVACTNQTALTAAYRAVVSRYHSRTVDFDIEGAALSNTRANQRRAVAIATLQTQSSPGRRLRVWLTLPVDPAGLSAAATSAISTMLRAGVTIDGVNVMTMDFGGSLPAGTSMLSGTESALVATQKQLRALYRQSGKVYTPRQVWQRMGATPMIGQNDVAGETFSLSDAHGLVAFAHRMHLARVSMWSANRDSQCGAQVLDDQVSNTCSGVKQNQLAFTWELGRLNGRLPDGVTAPAEADASHLPTRDNPATSPYPIWRTAKAYKAGDEIVWHQRVYEAKWFTQGDFPDAPVAHLWDTPWRYIGPILRSDAQTSAASAAAQLRAWDVDQVYLAGNQVLHNHLLYEAKWWTQADEPTSDPERADSSPWRVIGKAPANAAKADVTVTIAPAVTPLAVGAAVTPASESVHTVATRSRSR